jgi:hypothetical protein
MPIQEYPFHLYEPLLEIFPEQYSNNPFVVYHGTSILNSERIENNGFLAGIAPFEITDAIDLINLLRSPNFLQHDNPEGIFNQTIADGLEHYIQYLQSGTARLSFTSLSFAATSFAFGALKGGQAFQYVGKARSILQNAVFNDTSLRPLIPESVMRLLNYYDNIQNNFGVVYAINIPTDLKCFQLENNVLYTAEPILQNSIVAKVLVREIPNISLKIINDKLKSKLQKSTNPVGLQIHFGRNLYNDVNNS